jgi:hypothetical protein
MALKSPGGSTFPYYYKGGELHCLKFGSFFGDMPRLLQLMEAEEAFLLQWPTRRYRIWVDLYETTLSDSLMQQFTEHIARLGAQIVKLAIVGCSVRDQKRLTITISGSMVKPLFPIRFYEDPEDAKTWLVS